MKRTTTTTETTRLQKHQQHYKKQYSVGVAAHPFLFWVGLVVVVVLAISHNTPTCYALEQEQFNDPGKYHDLLKDPNGTFVKNTQDGFFHAQDSDFEIGRVTTFLPFSTRTTTTANDTGNVSLEPVTGMHNDGATALLAAHHVNTQEKTFCKYKIALDVMDSQWDRNHVSHQIKQLLTNDPIPPVAIVGDYSSSLVTPMAILTGHYQVAHIAPTASSLQLNEHVSFPLLGRMYADAHSEALAAIHLLELWNMTHFSVLYWRDPYGSSMGVSLETIPSTLTMAGWSVSDTLDEESTLTQIVNEIFEKKHRAIYVIGKQSMFLPLLEKVEEIHPEMLGPEYVWLFSGMKLADLQHDHDLYAHKNVQGMSFLQPMGGGIATDPYLHNQDREPPLEEGNNDNNVTTPYEEFRTAWRASLQDDEWMAYVRQQLSHLMYDDTVDMDTLEFAPEPSTNAPFLYDSIMALGRAICSEQQQEGIKKDNNDQNNNGDEDGGNNGQPLTAQDIMMNFKALNFTGASGDIVIRPGTGTRSSTNFAIWNLQEITSNDVDDDDKKKEYGLFPTLQYQQDNQWRPVGDNRHQFADATSTAPPPLPPVEKDYNYIPMAGLIITWALASIIVLACIVLLVGVYRNRSTRTVRSAQPLFLVMIAVGCLLIQSTTFPAGIDDDLIENQNGLDATCQAVPWLFAIGVCFVHAALLAKARGVYMAYSNPDLDYVYVTNKDFVIWLLWTLAANVIVLVTWTAVDPRSFVREDTEEKEDFGRISSSIGYCTSSYQRVFLGVIGFVNVVTLVIGNWWAWKSRNVETEYQESRYVGLSFFFLLQAWCLGVPILIVVEDEPAAIYFVGFGVITVCSLSTLVPIFIPKIMAIRSKSERRNDSEKRNSKTSGVEESTQPTQSPGSSTNKPGIFPSTVVSEEMSVSSSAAAKAENDKPCGTITENLDENSEKQQQEPETPTTLDQIPEKRKGVSFTGVESGEDEHDEDGFGEVGELSSRPSASHGTQTMNNQRGSFRSSAIRQSQHAQSKKGGIKIKYNPRHEWNMRVANGREMSKLQLDILQTKGEFDAAAPPSLQFHQSEPDCRRINSLPITTRNTHNNTDNVNNRHSCIESSTGRR